MGHIAKVSGSAPKRMLSKWRYYCVGIAYVDGDRMVVGVARRYRRVRSCKLSRAVLCVQSCICIIFTTGAMFDKWGSM
jgi:hypothetical protein